MCQIQLISFQSLLLTTRMNFTRRSTSSKQFNTALYEKNENLRKMVLDILVAGHKTLLTAYNIFDIYLLSLNAGHRNFSDAWDI